MATGLQIRRGTAAQNDLYTGLEGEITVDTDTWTLRVHDGVTPGGHLLGSQASRVTSVGLDTSSLGLETINSPVVTNGTFRVRGVMNVTSGGTGTSTPTLQVANPLTITGTWPDQVISFNDVLPVKFGGTGQAYPGLIAGDGISVTGPWPNQVISYTGQGLAAGQNISIANNQVNLTGFVPVANGGTGTNNPAPTGVDPILVTGEWPNNIISLTGVVPVRNGGTGTPTPSIGSTDTNIVVKGVWPNQTLSLNNVLSVKSITPANFAVAYPSISLDAQDNSITIDADMIKFRYSKGTSTDVFSHQAVQGLQGLLVAYSTQTNSVHAAATGIGYGSVYFDTVTIDTDNGFFSSNYKPVKAGWYRVQATVLVDVGTAVAGQIMYLQLRQNGVDIATVEETILSVGINTTPISYRKSMQVSQIIYMDGVSDQLSVALGTSTSTLSYVPGQSNTYLTVNLV